MCFYKSNQKKMAYLAFVTELVNQSQQDEGCLLYNHFESIDQPNQFIIVENWQDSSVVKNQNQTPL